MARVMLLMVALVLFAGCTSMRTVSSDIVTVEGRVSVRGNEPFSAIILETDDHNLYVLDVSPEQRALFSTPSRLSVTGPLDLGEFAGRPFAKIRVAELTVR